MTAEYLHAFAIAIVFFMIFAYFFNRTRRELDMRVVADDQRAAQSVGIRVTTIYVILIIAILIKPYGLPAMWRAHNRFRP